MKYYIHIPKLLEFALNVVCDDVALHGKQCLFSPIPYPLYLRCILTYADKYDKDRYSLYRLYRDIRRKVDVSVRIGRLYPNVLDHVVLDDGDVDTGLVTRVAISPFVDDAAASIQRFASRCLAVDKSEMLVEILSQAICINVLLPKPVLDVLLFYGAKLDQQDSDFFSTACRRGMNDVIQQAIENGLSVTADDVNAAIQSRNCDTIKLVFSAYRERYVLKWSSLINVTVESVELLVSLNILQHKTHYLFMNIPSFSVMQWILEHDMMEHDRLLIDVAFHASRYSGHYFDMLKYLIEQRNFTVPRDILARIEPSQSTDLDVFDYLIWHGAEVNAVGRWNVLERSPMLIRYWIDKGLIEVKSDDAGSLRRCIQSGMTVPVLEMMIDKYELNVNAANCHDYTALHEACRLDNYEVVEMLIKHGADVNKRNDDGETPYDSTSDDRIKQLLISFGYKT